MTGLLTAKETAAYLQVPVETLRAWRYERRGPAFVKVGKHVRYDPAALEAWISANTTQPKRAS